MATRPVPVPRVAFVGSNGILTDVGRAYVEQVAANQGSIANLDAQVAAILSSFAALSAQVTALASSVSALSASVLALQSSVAAIPPQIATIQAQIADLQADVSALEAEQNSFLLTETNSRQRVEDYSALLLQ